MKQIAVSLLMSLVMSFLALVCFAGAELRAASTVEEINGKVAKIDKRIKDNDTTLPCIETSYDFKDARVFRRSSRFSSPAAPASLSPAGST